MLKNHKNTWFTLSNILTASRLIAAPIIAFYILQGAFLTAFVLFAIASLTDSIDGHLARALNTQTLLGRLLDPVADKVLMTVTFWALAIAHVGVSYWFVVFLVCREIFLVGGAIFLLCTGKSATIRPSIWGKTATFLQVVCIGWFFMTILSGFIAPKITITLLFLVVFFSLIAFYDYAIQGKKNNFFLPGK